MKLKSILKRTLVLTMAAVTVALTFLQPFSAAEYKPKKYLKDVTINEFLADCWLDNIDYYHEDKLISGLKEDILYYEYSDGYTQILADSILANKRLIGAISAWEGLTFFEDIGGNTYDTLTTTSRYEVILIEMLRQLMKNQDIKESLSAKGSEVSAGLIDLFEARLSHMDLSVDEKIDQGTFIEAQNGIQAVFEIISPWLDMGVEAVEIYKVADVQKKCIEVWGEVDYEWMIQRIEWLDENKDFYIATKNICDVIEAGNFLLDQFFIVQDLLEKNGILF